MSHPYTHADHARRIAVANINGQAITIKPQFVQVLVGRTVCCAQIRDAWDTADGVEMWQVQLLGPIHGRMSAPARNVRQCQLIDGKCSCSPIDMTEAGAAGGDPARGVGPAAQSAPDGNHGETL